MDLKDTFTKGFLAGLTGGVSTTIVGYSLYFLKLSTLRFSDFSAILVYGHKPVGLWEALFAVLVHWGFAAAGGVVFAYLLKVISMKNLYIKGWFFGVGIWFFAYIVTTLFKVPGLAVISSKNAFANFLGSSVYGLVLAWTFAYIEHKIGKVKV